MATAPELPPTMPVASVHQVLQALSDPVRLEMIRRLAGSGEPTMACSALYDDISKSTASHHFKVLREAGLTERHTVGGTTHQSLAREAVDQALPGLLDSVLDALSAPARS